MTEEACFIICRDDKSIGNWFAGIKSYVLDAVPPKICVHLHLETDVKYSARDNSMPFSFCGI